MSSARAWLIAGSCGIMFLMAALEGHEQSHPPCMIRALNRSQFGKALSQDQQLKIHN
jgi:hypothetical protein